MTLPNGVTLRDFYDPVGTRAEILRRVQESLHKKFPLENERVRLELIHSAYDPKKSKYSLGEYQDAILKGQSLRVPLKGRVRLVDKASGDPLDEQDITLANVPYMTDDGTFVIGGNHYVTNNQSRLKPGIYARRKENGELESHFNVRPGTGQSMRLFMEPDTGVYRVNVGQSNIKLYPVLRGLGIGDPEIEKAWGPDITAANRRAYDSRAFGKFYTKLVGSRAVEGIDDGEKAKAIHESLNRMEFDPEVNSRTLGMTAGNASIPVLLRSSQKLLHISRKEDHEDDRDHPANRSFHTVDDFLADRISKDAGGLSRNLLYKTTYDRTLRHLRPGYFTPQLEGLIVGNSLSSPLPGINPMEVYDQQKRVVQLGEGGISSLESVPMSSRNVHPGQLGLIDPIRSAESSAVGVDQRFAIGAKKGSDNQIYFPLINKKTGKIEHLNPTQLHGKVVAFPGAPSLESFKTALPSPVLPLMQGQKVAHYVEVVVPDGKGSKLLHHYLKAQKWDLPAGRIEENETPIQAAVRELLERTGYQVDPSMLRATSKRPNAAGFYRFKAQPGSVNQVADPQTEVKWANLDDLGEVGIRETKAADLLDFGKTAAKAVDFDGTLAFLPEGKGIPFLGKPIKPMMDRVKRWLSDGHEVIIFTARAHDPRNIPPIKAWLKKHGLPPLHVTNKKLPWMEEFWDDKAIGVARNKGHVLSGKEAELDQIDQDGDEDLIRQWLSEK